MRLLRFSSSTSATGSVGGRRVQRPSTPCRQVPRRPRWGRRRRAIRVLPVSSDRIALNPSAVTSPRATPSQTPSSTSLGRRPVIAWRSVPNRPRARRAAKPHRRGMGGFTASCSLRDMGTHVCALPAGDHCPRGLVCLGCSHAQPKKSAAPVFRRMLHSHRKAARGSPVERRAGRPDRRPRARGPTHRDSAAARRRNRQRTSPRPSRPPPDHPIAGAGGCRPPKRSSRSGVLCRDGTHRKHAG